MAKPYQFKVALPKGYSEEVREAIADEIISFVRQRTLKNKDVDGEKFPPYSEAYKNSVDFRATGKSNKVNLTLSGDMLASMELVKNKGSELVLGYADSSDQAGKAEGNQIGSYGRKPDANKARKFLGITDDDLLKILEKYPTDEPEKAELRAEAVAKAQDKIDKQLESVDVEKLSLTELFSYFRLKVGPRGK